MPDGSLRLIAEGRPRSNRVTGKTMLQVPHLRLRHLRSDPAPVGRPDPADRSVRVRHALLLAVTVATALLPTILFQQPSRIFLLKLGLAVLLSILPGWLYLQFIRFRGRSLYDEYVLNLFRLRIDEYCNLPAPPQHTSYHGVWRTAHEQLGTDTRDNLYRHKFEAIYGKRAVSTSSLIYDQLSQRDQTETFSPVLMATMLLSIGWVLVAQPELLRGFDLLHSQLPFSGKPQLPYELIQFGFIGAYWFILQDLIRRYFRDDLKTSAYISASARIVLVTVLVTTVSLVPFGTPAQQKVLAFAIGVFPQLGLQVLKAAVVKPFGRLIPTVKTDHPLSDLSGLSIWDEARLLEEGIEDMQNLVSGNIVDLLLRSRVPVNRLVDWLDQAYLYMRVPKRLSGPRSEHTPRVALRELGIRTATDLERVWSAVGDDAAFQRRVSHALGVPAKDGPAVVRSILAAFQNEVNLFHVREFRAHTWLRESGRPDHNGKGAGLPAGASLN
jgi:hypothetical protein